MPEVLAEPPLGHVQNMAASGYGSSGSQLQRFLPAPSPEFVGLKLLEQVEVGAG